MRSLGKGIKAIKGIKNLGDHGDDPLPHGADGVVEIAFASQKKYGSIYGLKSDVLEAHRAEFPGASIGKGCIRYTKPDQVDLAAVERLLKATAASDGKLC